MQNHRGVAPRIAGALLVAVGLGACEGREPVGPDSLAQQTAFPTQCTTIDIDAIYSGPPAREAGLINLNDQYVFVEVYDIEQYLPRLGVAAGDVRIGDSWESGTGAQSFEILDIDEDGARDIRLRFLKTQLVTDGNLDENTTELQVWGLDRTEGGDYCASEPVEVTLPPPAPGQDVVVLNDINIFDQGAMQFAGTDNHDFVRNLVNFTSEGPRNDGTVVIWDRGRNSACGPNPAGNDECRDANMAITRSVIADEGFTFLDLWTSAGGLTQIPAEVKSIWLWTPRVFFTNAEINALKQFAAEGGRVVFIGEWDGFYGAQGIATQNDFLQKMGAVMRNTGGAVNCGYTTLGPASIRGHQVTEAIGSLRMACASIIAPGPQDFVLFYDTSVSDVLGGVARIDTTPISLQARFPAPAVPLVETLTNFGRATASGR